MPKSRAEGSSSIPEFRESKHRLRENNLCSLEKEERYAIVSQDDCKATQMWTILNNE